MPLPRCVCVVVCGSSCKGVGLELGWLFVSFSLLISRAWGISAECFQTIDLLGICLFLRKLFSPGSLHQTRYLAFTEQEILTGRSLGQVRWTGGPFAPQSVQELSCLCSCKIAASEGARGTGYCDCAWMLLRVPESTWAETKRIELDQDVGCKRVNMDWSQHQASEVRLLDAL